LRRLCRRHHAGIEGDAWLDPGEAIKVFFKQVPECPGDPGTRADPGRHRHSGLCRCARVIKTNGMDTWDRGLRGNDDLVMKYLAKESDQRPDVPKMMTNQFGRRHKPSPVEWDQMQANAQEFVLFELTRDRGTALARALWDEGAVHAGR